MVGHWRAKYFWSTGMRTSISGEPEVMTSAYGQPEIMTNITFLSVFSGFLEKLPAYNLLENSFLHICV